MVNIEKITVYINYEKPNQDSTQPNKAVLIHFSTLTAILPPITKRTLEC